MLIFAWPCWGADVRVVSIPKDTCIVDALADARVHISVAGVDRGPTRQFLFDGLSENSSRMVIFSATTADGSAWQREVLLLPGERIVLPIRDESRLPEVVVQTGHSTAVTALAFSPNGKYLFSGADGGVAMWDVASGRKSKG